MTSTPRLILQRSVERHSSRNLLTVSAVHIVDLDDDLDALGADTGWISFLDAEVESASPADPQVAGLFHEHFQTMDPT